MTLKDVLFPPESCYIGKKDTIMGLYEYDKDIFERKNILAEKTDVVEE